MKRITTTPKPSPRPESRDAVPNAQPDQGERFRATARHAATQIHIEAAMWEILGKSPE